MKQITFFTLAGLFAIGTMAQETGSFTDARDGKTYKTVKIGNQTWMAENLAYKPSYMSHWVYENNNVHVETYGYLYNWNTATKVCPTGWHLPSDAEWTTLSNFLGSNAVKKLKAKNGWAENGNGTDDFGFSALPGGYLHAPDKFFQLGKSGYWWSSTPKDTYNALNRYMSYNAEHQTAGNVSKNNGYSVRCIKD